MRSRGLIIAVAILCVIAIMLIGIGITGGVLHNGEQPETLLSSMRLRALLVATGEGATESFIAVAKRDARERAQAEGVGMAGIREATEKAEEEARARALVSLIDYDDVDTGALEAALLAVRAAMGDYSAEEARALAAFVEKNAPQIEEELEQEIPPAIDDAHGPG